MKLEEFITDIAVGFEVTGAIAMVVGFVLAIYLAGRSLARGNSAADAYQTLRNTLGSAIMLGLEILVAADLIRTISSKPSITDALVLGIIVLIRTLLSMSIQIEIEGVLPWKRAALTSGGQLLARSIAQERSSGRQSSPPAS